MAKPKGASFTSLPPLIRQPRPALEVYLIFTTFEATRRALLTAQDLADGLGLRLVLLVPQVVPYPLPLENPPIAGEFLDSLMKTLSSGLEASIEVRRYLCRDRDETLRRVILRDSIVLIGSNGGWPHWGARRLGRQLRRDGHQVILIDVDRVSR